MLYTREEEEQFTHILSIFKNYIENNEVFDIVYSRKAGYIKILIDSENTYAEKIENPSQLLNIIFSIIFYDVLADKSELFIDDDKIDKNKLMSLCEEMLYSVAETTEDEKKELTEEMNKAYDRKKDGD